MASSFPLRPGIKGERLKLREAIGSKTRWNWLSFLWSQPFLSRRAGGNTETATPSLSIFVAFEGIKTDFPWIGRPKGFPREGAGRAGLDTDLTVTAIFFQRMTDCQRSVGQNRDPAHSRSEGLRDKQAAFPDPSQSGEVGSQFVGKKPLEFLGIELTGRRNRIGLKVFAAEPAGHIIGQGVERRGDDLIGMV